MKSVYYIIGIIVTAVLASCSSTPIKSVRIPQPSDSLYTAQAAMYTYPNDSELALTIIDSAEMIGNVDPFTADFVRATIYIRSLDHPQKDKGLEICKHLLEHDSTQAVTRSTTDHRLNVLHLMTDVYRFKKDNEQWLKNTIEIADLNSKWGYATEALRNEAEIGIILTHLGRQEEGVKKLDHAIGELKKNNFSVDCMDAWIVAVKRKMNVLEEMNRPEEIIPLAFEIIEKLDHYQQHADEYTEDSFRLPSDEEDRSRYCEFIRAQAHAFLANSYAKLGQIEKADDYLNLFEQSGLGRSFSGRIMIAPVWKALGEWDKLLAIDHEIESMIGDDTLNDNFATILLDYAEASHFQGQPDQAYHYMCRYSSLQQQLFDQLHESEAQDYAARYHAQDQEMKLQSAKAAAQRKNIIIGITLLLLVLATLISIYYRHQRKIVSEKNRALVRLINEQANQKDTPAPKTETPDPELFRTIDNVIRQERLYANITFQRQDILDRFDLRRQTLNNLLSAYANGMSFPSYINDIRLQEALNLLREEPNMTISAIAESVGFTLANFRVQFKQRYGITPAEYRSNL